MATLPSYQYANAIIGQETSHCTTGVAVSKNNCGGIRDHKTGDFKVYENKYESIKDIARLLNTPRYKGKTIDQINGTYCVDEEKGSGKCPDWTENINKYVKEIVTY